VRQGQLVQVTLVNESVAGGTALHWHGVDVPNSQDGVAGVTQDAVPVGGSHVYRFVAEDAGTYWYHSHQVSHDQVLRGLLGALVVEPAAGASGMRDVVALLHSYAGQPTLNGRVADEHVVAAAGERMRVRVINTDNVLTSLWASGGYLLAAVDGTEVHGPTEVRGQRVPVTAGARADLLVQAPLDGSAVRVHLGGARSIVVGPAGVEAPRVVAQPAQKLDLLRYGSPAPLGFDPTQPDRRFDYVIGRRPGLIDGRPGMFWTINGRLYPDVPMYYVRQGDVGRMRIENRSSEGHPMHLHGHHVLVLSRDGVPSTGSPWWTDSLEVAADESYEVAFVADNPGIWMDHCHNLPHAVEGMVAHLVYEGVTTPFLVDGPAHNHPE
jgi:FtsP/CotA-like multicopper oxidase with cupredoxin domain